MKVWYCGKTITKNINGNFFKSTFVSTGRMLMDAFDWKNGLFIISAVVLNCVVCGALMRPLEPPKKKKPRRKNFFDRLVCTLSFFITLLQSCAFSTNKIGVDILRSRLAYFLEVRSEYFFGSIVNSYWAYFLEVAWRSVCQHTFHLFSNFLAGYKKCIPVFGYYCFLFIWN